MSVSVICCDVSFVVRYILYIVSILVFRQQNELSKNKSIRKTLVTCQHKNG